MHHTHTHTSTREEEGGEGGGGRIGGPSVLPLRGVWVKVAG